MRKLVVLAALLVPALLAAAPARAADPALVTGVEKYLRDDEKALLAALLTHPDISAEFDAGAPLALKDPRNLAPFLGVWRGKLEGFAEADGRRGNPNLDARYGSYAQLMTPEQRAYMVRRLRTMDEDDRNSLIGYLNSINETLAKNGELSWYTKKVAAGILDHYRAELNAYAATPIAQAAKRDAASSAEAFAAVRKADEDARLAAAKAATPPEVEPADVPDVKPPSVVKHAPTSKQTAKPAPVKHPTIPPAPDPGSVVTTDPAGGALDQARNAASAGADSGRIFDGGAAVGKPDGGGAVIVPPESGGAHPTLAPGKPGSEAGLNGSTPVPPAPTDAGFMDSIQKMQTKPAPAPLVKRLAPVVGGVLGGILGGAIGAVIGFFIGGPIGAAAGAAFVGAVIGAGLGAGGGYLLAKHLF